MSPKKSKKNNNHITQVLFDQNNGLYVEDYFTEVLSNERKRTERTKRPFLLMLLDIERFQRVKRKDEVLKDIASVLFSSTREIDVKGWYKHDSIIGVLFTEMNGTDKTSLREKIHGNLSGVLGKEFTNRIEISLYIFPQEDGSIKLDSTSHLYPDLEKKNNSRKGALLFKRFIDVIGSIAGLIIFSPLLLIIPLLIKLTSKGDVFFRQERIGQYGERFTFLKFRTMYINNDPKVHQEYINKFILEQKSYDTNEKKGNKDEVFKIKDDPRVTFVGKFLRKTSLDELPQFLNVLKGEMSIVGPRPPVPYEVKIYDIWHKRRLMEVKPGITGLWQTKGRSSTTFDEMVRLDIRYIIGWSVWLDIKIILLTPWVVLTGKGAY